MRNLNCVFKAWRGREIFFLGSYSNDMRDLVSRRRGESGLGYIAQWGVSFSSSNKVSDLWGPVPAQSNVTLQNALTRANTQADR